jgi:hypothetical protein
MLAFMIGEVFIELHPRYEYEVLWAVLAVAVALAAGMITGIISIWPKSN